ncbi:MAG TPA: DUF2252 domain-containing protein [Pseudonocardia sp.]|uniref:DUF2252 domain-containing protein n=1 Tax=Pseudonocardia sp. TaxID=60912 RepID=UPI002CDD3EDA|nr:DUF2252 domain-containing protein [Pseudonocardia sp.]HTF50462.1 DUF2252 domain-containing protein [Pseudonocardia sp.]
MSKLADRLRADEPEARTSTIVDTLVDAFAHLMEADEAAFRAKFRKMAADPFAFYRGSDCLFLADVAGLPDPWADERTSRVWIQGDLHAENFGTYMDGNGALIFDVNDFDEAYLGHFTWDLQRLAASVALLGWRKALSDDDISRLVERYTTAYLDQVRQFVHTDRDHEFSLRLDNTEGAVQVSLQSARLSGRAVQLESMTELHGYERTFKAGPGVRRLDDGERALVDDAFERYLETIPEEKRLRGVVYTVKDVVGRSGFGIGSAGLPAYNVLIEGFNQALDNDVVLSMKQGNVAALSRVVTDRRIAEYFLHHGHRTAVSQRALQAHAEPLLGYTELDGTGFVVRELSPYEADLDWGDINEPDEMAQVLEYLGRATAKAHCVSDADADTALVEFQTEDAIVQTVGDRDEEFVGRLVEFAHDYAAIVRADHRLFVDAFREGRIPGVRSTG